MKPRVLLLCLLLPLTMGNRGCQTTETVVIPEGPKAAELSAAKDKQIGELTKQTGDLKTARAAEQAEAAKAASNLKGVLKATEYMPEGLPTDAAKAEAELGLTRLPKDDPAETVKALERVVLIVTGQRDAALKLYAEADAATKLARTEIAAKDAEITKRDGEIAARVAALTKLTQEKEAEAKAKAGEYQAALDKKDKELADFKKEQASKERAQWVLWTRIAGLGLIVVGVVLLAVFKLVAEGAGLAAGGVIIGLISIFIDWLTSQVWFPYLMGSILLGALVAAYFAIRRLYLKGELHNKVTAALVDLKDEAVTLGNNSWETVSGHLKYRLGDKNSVWGAEQAKEIAKLGLVNPAAESDAPPKS